ncbi:MAG: RNA-guided pseudouridylation complex pseudouridine synthase subunit Cbf5 [Nanoarchaeota archaeon]|nr:RNA-guided pseudouridylation complex pseudouridine synthase subunit Cbf5 [DPANN group archaeon]MBL7116951.1 RNA-guided pseudouridylation complex pseudouridine synthase subunit Cbf5 [Nanoarchaeota archaeon]
MGKLPFELRKREILVKRDADTDPKFGKKPSDRSVDEVIGYGVVNIDKPEGPSSHQVSAYARNILRLKKAGHSGTLDPKVTGVLPVALGRATRITHSLLTAGKEYICLMRLHKELDEKTIRKIMNEFVGKIKQLPPIKSAVKRQERFRHIYYLEILEIDRKDVLFIVGSQAGTYIRKLCHDIGEKLGVGANMYELRRTKAGPFSEETLCILQDLKDAYHFYKEGDEKYLKKIIQPVEFAVEHLLKIWVLDTTVDSLCHGATLKVPGIAKLHEGIEPDMRVAVMTLKDELVMTAIAKLNSQKILKEEKGIAAKPDQVFMKPGTYPKIEKV